MRKNVFGVEILDENLLTSLLFFVCGAGFDDVSCLRCATLDDLKEAGVLVGHARKILAAFGGSEEADAIETVVLEEQGQPQEQPEAEPEEKGDDTTRQAWTDAPASPPLPAAAAAAKPATPARPASTTKPAKPPTPSKRRMVIDDDVSDEDEDEPPARPPAKQPRLPTPGYAREGSNDPPPVPAGPGPLAG